jgi:hypothetical protein
MSKFFEDTLAVAGVDTEDIKKLKDAGYGSFNSIKSVSREDFLKALEEQKLKHGAINTMGAFKEWYAFYRADPILKIVPINKAFTEESWTEFMDDMTPLDSLR